MDSGICQTSTASPAEPGSLPTDQQFVEKRFENVITERKRRICFLWNQALARFLSALRRSLS